MIQLGEALGLLSRARVGFIVVGGVAAIAHGSARLTFDLDVSSEARRRACRSIGTLPPSGAA